MAIDTRSNPNALGNNGSRFYGFPFKPVFIDAQFTVQSADTGGLGITNLKGMGVNTVFMYTSATAGVGPNGVTNPLTANPSKGFIWMQLANNYKYLNSLEARMVSPITGSALNVDLSDAALTVGTPYSIVTLGTSTTADWQAIGLPLGLLPTVGQAFVATATGAGVGTGTVKALGTSTISAVEIVGTAPQQSLFPTPTAGISPNVGAWIMLQCIAPSTAAPTLTMNSYTPAGTITNGTPDTFAGTPATLTGTISAPATTLGPIVPANGSQVYVSMIVNAR